MSIARKTIKKLVEVSQKLNNRLYKKEGLTDRVLNNQVKINNFRMMYDLTDECEIVGEEGFVQ